MNRQAGFTLVEMLVALVIFMIFVGAVYGTYHTAYGAMSSAEEVDDLYQAGRVLLTQLNTELTCTYQSSTATVCAVLGEDTAGDAAGLQMDTLTLVTTAHAPFDEQPAGDLCQVRYTLSDGTADEEPGLYVEENWYPDLALEDAVPVRRLLSPLVVGFNCRYLAAGGEDWETEWPEQTTLPVAVRVELTLLGSAPNSKPLVLVSTANLALATAPQGGTDDLP